MNVTKPEMSTALLYWSLTAVERNQRYMVVAIMLAKAKDKTLYTAWYCKSVMAYIVMAERFGLLLHCQGCTQQVQPGTPTNGLEPKKLRMCKQVLLGNTVMRKVY